MEISTPGRICLFGEHQDYLGLPVIPMAISLSFGILFATVITLFLVPSLYMLREDFGRLMSSAWKLLLGRPSGEIV